MPKRFLRIIGLCLLALFLTGVFVTVRFPYARLARALEARAEQMAGLRLSLGDLQPYFGLRGVGLHARDVRATPRQGQPASLESLRVRPALSPQWLRGRPALHIDVESVQIGSVNGAIVLDQAAAWDGELKGVDLEWLPLERIASGVAMRGRVDAEADVSVDADGTPSGPLVFEATDGSIRLPGLPIDVPFTTLKGDIELGGDLYARVKNFELTGPLVSATLVGTIQNSAQAGQQPIDMKLALHVRGRELRPMLRDFGLQLGRDGKAELQLTGTLSNPTFK